MVMFHWDDTFAGNVVALHGKETSAGEFLVLDVLDAGLAPQKELPLNSGMS